MARLFIGRSLLALKKYKTELTYNHRKMKISYKLSRKARRRYFFYLPIFGKETALHLVAQELITPRIEYPKTVLPRQKK